MSIYSHYVGMGKLLSTVKLVRGALTLVRNPNRLDEVIELADEISRPEVMEEFVVEARKRPEAAQALAKKPRVHIDLPAFRRLPDGTLGREFARFVDAAGIDPADLPHRPARDEHEWVRAHLFETHDIWHVVTGFGTDVAGELGLQAVYLAQLPARLAPLLLSIGFLNTFIYAFDDKDRRMDEVARGWRLGRRAKQLFGVEWDNLWTVPLSEVRARLRVQVEERAEGAAA